MLYLRLYTKMICDHPVCEVVGKGYARQPIHAEVGHDGIKLLADVEFGPATEDWGDVVAWGISEDENPIHDWGEMFGGDAVLKGDMLRVAKGFVGLPKTSAPIDLDSRLMPLNLPDENR